MGKKINILLVAWDVAPSRALELISEELRVQRGQAYITSFLGNGKSIGASDNDVIKGVQTSDIVVIGMSSSPELAAKEILAAQTAMEAGIPFGFYADTFSTWARPWFEPCREKASFLFVLNKEEAEGATKIFPNATILATGNPMWEEQFAFPKHSAEEARRLLGIDHDDLIILAPGTKVPAINCLLWGNLLAARNMTDRDWQIVVTLHPGDKTPQDVYNPFITYGKFLFSDQPTSDILPAADLVIESLSTMAIEAGYQRIPVIEFVSELAALRLEEMSGGSRFWEVSDSLGIARRIEDRPDLLKDAIIDLTGNGQYEMRCAQEEALPIPVERGVAIKLIADHLLAVVGE